MLDELKNGDLVIVPNHIKKELLKEITKQKNLINIHCMTKEEFINNYFGTYDEKSLYYLVKKYKLKPSIAKEYLDNIYFKDEYMSKYYDYLNENNLLIKNKLFKNNLNNIVVIGYELDPYIKEELSKYNTRYIKKATSKKDITVYEFDNQTDEIVYIASDISKKLKTININDICLINVTDDYKSEIKRIFKLFNIPVNIDTKKTIYGTNTLKKFMNNLKIFKEIQVSLDSIVNSEIKNKIIDVLNKYTFVKKIDNTFIEILNYEFKNTYINLDTYKNAVCISNIDTLNKNKHYYLLGFNADIMPRLEKDDRLIKDKDRKSLGLFSSTERYKTNKKNILNSIYYLDNLTITYKLKDKYLTYQPSPLIIENNFNVIKNESVDLVYSHKYNHLLLSYLLDNYINYNEKGNNLESLLNTYSNIDYKVYDNKFTGIKKDKIIQYVKEKVNLSYSSMTNYYLCSFRYLLDNILKLNKYEDTFNTLIGNLFHKCLSHMYDRDFDLKKVYYDYLKDEELCAREKFFIDCLYHDLQLAISYIQDHDKHSSLDKVETEKHIKIEKNNTYFHGYIDKIKYNDKVHIIVDYKTGNIDTSLDNIEYGFNMQLPSYIYLLKNSNIDVDGFYFLKILPNYQLNKDEEPLKLEGYTIDDEDIICQIDDSYENSEVIKGLKKSQKGFYHYSKLVSREDIDKIEKLVSNKIKQANDNIKEGKFDINPKRIDGNLKSCEYCPFRDICFRKEEDIVDLKNKKYKEGDAYASVD